MIQTVPERNQLLDEYSQQILKDRYYVEEENTPQEAFARVAAAYQEDEAHGQRMYDYASQLWLGFSSPILSNGGTSRGLPISCFLSDIADSRAGLAEHYAENIWLSSMGGGIGSYWGNLRSDGVSTSQGSKSTGTVPFIKVVDSQTLAFNQGTTRRGAYAAYQDIHHPEIEEFIGMRKPTGGDTNRKCFNLHHGVNVTDKFMQLIDDLYTGRTGVDEWDLIDPHTKMVTRTVSAKALWDHLLRARLVEGEPYVHFIDTTNNALPQCQRDLGLYVNTSNLCSEITLPTDSRRTAVCCLSSLNLEYYDEWKDTTIVEDLVLFLDNVLQSFIDTAPDTMSKAKYSAMRERSIGVGAMGFHAYLQKKGVPFESAMAVGINRNIFRFINTKAYDKSIYLGVGKGVAPDMDMWADGRRNVHLLAIAPTATNSIICGNTSPSVEPYRTNIYTQQTHSGSNIKKNKFLDAVLKGKDGGEDVYHARWKSIRDNQGSIQHMRDVFTPDELDTFKTAEEIDQMWIIEHAGHRQEYTDQAQSINLFFGAAPDMDYAHRVHMAAWKKGLKTLYYCKPYTNRRAENISTSVERIAINRDDEECISCQ
jgi:ribonucleoside-diphosphate reductase alpha chain